MGFLANAIGAQQQAQALSTEAGIYSTQGGQQQTIYNLGANIALQNGGLATARASGETEQAVQGERAAFASSGVDAGAGTAGEVQADTRSAGQLQQNIIENNAARHAWGLKLEGQQAFNQAQLHAFGAMNQAQADDIQAQGDMAGGVFSTGSNLASLFAGGVGGGGSGGSSAGSGSLGAGDFNAGGGGSLLG